MDGMRSVQVDVAIIDQSDMDRADPLMPHIGQATNRWREAAVALHRSLAVEGFDLRPVSCELVGDMTKLRSGEGFPTAADNDNAKEALEKALGAAKSIVRGPDTRRLVVSICGGSVFSAWTEDGAMNRVQDTVEFTAEGTDLWIGPWKGAVVVFEVAAA